MSTNQAPQYLTPEQVAHLLRAHAAQIQAEMEALPDAALAWHPEAGEWCVKEVVGHIIEAERRGFAGRIRTLLDQDSPRFAAWDQRAVGAGTAGAGPARSWASTWRSGNRAFGWWPGWAQTSSTAAASTSGSAGSASGT
jgi:DinB superfamily